MHNEVHLSNAAALDQIMLPPRLLRSSGFPHKRKPRERA